MLKKIAFHLIAFLCIAGLAWAEAGSCTSKKVMHELSTEDGGFEGSLDRVSGQYDRGILPDEASYQSKNHRLYSPLQSRSEDR